MYQHRNSRSASHVWHTVRPRGDFPVSFCEKMVHDRCHAAHLNSVTTPENALALDNLVPEGANVAASPRNSVPLKCCLSEVEVSPHAWCCLLVPSRALFPRFSCHRTLVQRLARAARGQVVSSTTPLPFRVLRVSSHKRLYVSLLLKAASLFLSFFPPYAALHMDCVFLFHCCALAIHACN